MAVDTGLRPLSAVTPGTSTLAELGRCLVANIPPAGELPPVAPGEPRACTVWRASPPHV